MSSRKTPPKININSKTTKYYLARKKGKTKRDSALEAGFARSTAHSPSLIENTKEFKALETFFKDELLTQISLRKIAQTLTRNLEQDHDLGASNAAIKIALERIEPDGGSSEKSDQVLVILKETTTTQLPVEIENKVKEDNP